MTTAQWQGPLLIVGCSRSGTTLIQQMLNAHPDVAILPESQFVPSYWVCNDQCQDVSTPESFARMVRAVAASAEFADTGIDGAAFEAAALQGPRTLPAVFGLLLDLFAEAKKARIKGEKTPAHVLYMDRLKDAFPSAKFIHMVRDPRAVVCSRRTLDWAEPGWIDNAYYWMKVFETVRAQAPRLGPDLRTVRYEDLVAAPREVLEEICAFIGVAFDASMLEHWRHNRQWVNTRREPWKAKALEPLHPARIDAWRSELTGEALLQVEAIVWPAMRTYGYRAAAPMGALLPRAALRMVQRVRSRLRKAAGPRSESSA